MSRLVLNAPYQPAYTGRSPEKTVPAGPLHGTIDGMSPSDGQLLERFLRASDSAAFAALVERHGSMVLGVCRRVLADANDADDAFQATFLILARRGRAIRSAESVASWLHGVAYRLAAKLRTQTARRRQHERRAADMPNQDPISLVVWHELRPVLDEELSRLPEQYRAPLVLCYLQGKTNAEAAVELGWPAGTLKGRLHRAREMLRGRLARRGVALSSGLLFSTITWNAATASVPAALTSSTVVAASHFVSGSAVGAISAPVIALAEGALKTMMLTKLHAVAAIVLAAGLVGVGAFTYRSLAADGPATGGQYSQVAQAPSADDDPAKPAKDEAWKLSRTLTADDEVLTVAFSPDGKLLATGGKDKRIVLWDPATGKKIAELVHRDAILSVAFSPDGRFVAGSSKDGGLSLAEAPTGKGLWRIAAHDRDVYTVRFAPDGKAVVSGGRDATVRLWDPETGKEIRRIVAPKDVLSLAISPDGRRIVVGSDDKTVRAFDVTTGKLIWESQGHQRRDIYSLAFSPDGKLLASAGEDREVRLWDATTGREVRTLVGHTDEIFSVSFAQAGDRLFTGSKDGTIRIWDLDPGAETVTIKSHDGAVRAVVLSPDGRMLVTVGTDKTIRLFLADSAPRKTAVIRPVGAADRLDRLTKELMQGKRTDAQIIEALTLATLGRLPTEIELKAMQAAVTKRGDRDEAFKDIVFALTNSKEFTEHVEALKKRDPRGQR